MSQFKFVNSLGAKRKGLVDFYQTSFKVNNTELYASLDFSIYFKWRYLGKTFKWIYQVYQFKVNCIVFIYKFYDEMYIFDSDLFWWMQLMII